MKKIKILLLFISIFSFFSVQAGFNYPYVCWDSWCYDTELKELKPADPGYFIADPVVITNLPTFKSYIDDKLQDYVDYYGSDTFVINNYYSWSGSAYNRSLTLTTLLNINTTFYIDKPATKTYANGKDYLFENFTSIINQLHFWYPFWDKKNKLSDILKNITYYDTSLNKFAVRNVCWDATCNDTNYWFIAYSNTTNYKVVNGMVKPNSAFVVDNFKVSSAYTVSDYFLKAGESLDFDFWYEDYLDVWSLNTKYKYTISYQYDWEPMVDFLTETINISKTFNVSSPNIDPALIGDIVDLNVLSSSLKKVRVWITEWINLTKPGKIFFYLTVENLNTGDKFNKAQVNFAPVIVLPSDNVKSGEANIDSAFSKTLNDAGFNIWDTFSVSLSLKDLYGNEHYDYIDGYDISLSAWSSDKIELAKAWSSIYSSSLVGVKTNTDSPYFVNFKFRVTQSGYHALTGFDVTVREKKTNYVYTTIPKYFTITNIFPTNMYDGVKKMKIFIKSPLVSDFPVTCTKGSIIFKTNCTSDNFSGCNPLMDKSITFTSQAQNGTTGVLTIQDYAYNVKNYNYTMNHIDQTAPTISAYKWSTQLLWASYNYKANDDDFTLKFYEWTTSNCDAQIHYLVKVNGTQIYNATSSWSSFDLILPTFLTADWAKNLYVKATDKYGNFSEKTMNFNIYPAMFVASGSTLVVDTDSDKYADFIDNYNYTLVLKDKYGNPIVNKNVDIIDQSCVWALPWCKTLQLNMISNSWGDALDEYDYPEKTDATGKITFKLRSVSPWIFTQRFKITMNSWDDNYNDVATSISFYDEISSDTNGFKKPFSGLLRASKDGVDYTIKPEIGTELFYRVNINSIPSVTALSISLDDYKGFVKATDPLTSAQWVSNVDNLNAKVQNFKARIDTSASATSLGIPWLKIADGSNQTPIEISYTLDGRLVTNYLSEDDLPASRKVLSVENTQKAFLWVKVLWALQWSGKQTITGQKSNFSDISKSDARTSIRKSAYEYIKNMTSGTTFNGVKYVVWDISISWIQDYETLIVKDGNVKITGDLYPSTTYKKLWIIVLKDSYKVEDGFNGKWNVLVYPNVKLINAVIYADGGLISSDSSGNVYTTDTTTRSNALSKQLVINGTLFTRNTIGWAILAGWSYILPWWSTISDFNKAMVYDLNYVRRGSNDCDKNSNTTCTDTWEYSDVFVIKYDSKIQLSPPKVFNTK